VKKEKGVLSGLLFRWGEKRYNYVFKKHAHPVCKSKAADLSGRHVGTDGNDG
jgi:hypothetical protein